MLDIDLFINIFFMSVVFIYLISNNQNIIKKINY